MAVYDPPNGSVDPRPRCTGNCCRSFSIENTYEEIQNDYAQWQLDPTNAKIPDVALIAPMLLPLGKFRGQEVFTCRHLDEKKENCTVYETRPAMCRDFPGPSPCPYRNCASHGRQSMLVRALNWLRD